MINTYYKEVTMEIGKKILLFTQFMLIIVSMIITSFVTEKYIEFHFTHTDTIMVIDYADDIGGKVSDFANTLREFSIKHHVNFIQRSYLSDQLTVLYTSNNKADARFSDYNPELLEGSHFISSVDTNEQEQIGILKAYISDVALRVYDIENIVFSGLENDIFIYGFSNKLMPDLVESLSDFGEIRIHSSSMTVMQLMKRVSVSSTLLIFPLVSMCLIFMFIVVTFIYVRGQSRLIAICRLAGKSNAQILYDMTHVILRTGIIKASLLALSLSIMAILTVKYELIFYYPYVIFISFLVTLCVCLIIQMFIAFIVIKRTKENDPFSKKSNNRMNIVILSVLKVLAITVLLYALTNVFSNYDVYTNYMHSMSNWVENENVHRIIVSSEAEKYRGDLIKERSFNDRCSSLYDQLIIKNNAFIISSKNFRRVSTGKGEQYLYEQAVVTRKDILSPSGSSIIVDKAYLLKHAIISTENDNVHDVIVSDPNVLNIIVPSKFREDEIQIYDTYLEYFYFQKVTVDNIYNEAIGHPMNTQNISELKVNIIYSKDDQNYFTYSSHTGDFNGNIKDPIAIVYNPVVDSSYIMSLLTSSVFIVSDRKEAAFFDISSSVIETGVREVKSTRSVFSEVGKVINNTKTFIAINVVLLIISTAVFLSIIVQYTLLLYSINKKKMTIQYLIGSDLMQHKLNAQIILLNALVVVFALRFMKNPMVFYVLILLTLIEVYTVNRLSRYNTEKNAGSIVKG